MYNHPQDRNRSSGHRHTHGQSHGPAHAHHDDHHHYGAAAGPAEVSRRQMFYLLGSGVLAAALIPDLAAATTKRHVTKRPSTTTTKTKATLPTTTTTKGTVATTRIANSVVDPWTLFPNTVRATRTTTELPVESTGLPEHQMMVGITNWQQQVPVPQSYSGTNSWRIPLHGVLADNPISAKTALFRGAIALAINGVPIFNALNNRGEDAFMIGELDQWGGHCGRADDYHYHVSPLHLQKVAGPATPIAVALDGFPVYGLTEPDGSTVRTLDAFNGHADANDTYHYHSTLTYPYINGGMRGRVQVVDQQVDPQPSARPFRPAGNPLRGASITSFTNSAPGTYSLQYRLGSDTYRIDYLVKGTMYRFTFTDPTGATRTETYQPR